MPGDVDPAVGTDQPLVDLVDVALQDGALCVTSLQGPFEEIAAGDAGFAGALDHIENSDLQRRQQDPVAQSRFRNFLTAVMTSHANHRYTLITSRGCAS